MAKNKSITLCADDYALSHGVSAGILEALRAGRLSAVSALTNGPRWPALGRDLARGEFDADIGLHFNLTLGAPLGTMPKFAPKGAFPSVSEVIRLSVRGKLPMDEILEEIDRQLDRFQAVMLRPPDFVDGHQMCRRCRRFAARCSTRWSSGSCKASAGCATAATPCTAFFCAARRSKRPWW